MNVVVLVGRLAREPEIRTTTATNVAKYTLAVDRKFKREGEETADFISCVAFGRNAEFAEKYLSKGKKIAITGRIQTGSYTNKDGHKVYTTDVVVESQEFVESKTAETTKTAEGRKEQDDGFMAIPDSVDDVALPWM